MYKTYFLFALIHFVFANIHAQTLQILHSNFNGDSSLYHIAPISEGNFWIGGKNGILKSLNLTGFTNSIKNTNTSNILKIEKENTSVFMSATNGYLHKYNLEDSSFTSKQYQGFEEMCIYDFLLLDNDSILLCGGHNDIAAGEKNIPYGFIAMTDKNLTTLKIVWSCWRKFPWSICKNENQEIFVSIFNGMNSHIQQFNISSRKLIHVQTIKGLVHEISWLNNELWYAGSKNIRYNETGIMGKVLDKKICVQNDSIGCIWSMSVQKQNVLGVTQSGELVEFNPLNKVLSRLEIKQQIPFYMIQEISNSDYLITGSGGLIYKLRY